MSLCFVMVAGEASGDRLGAALIAELKLTCQAVRFIGVPGPLMRAAGCEAWFEQEELAVMGVVDVIKHLPRLLKRRKQVLQDTLRLRPTAYIGIDAPDFNLPLERRLKKCGIKTVHVNSPTVWAWRAGRLKSIRASVDLMLLLFPFEQAIYQRANIPAVYIGHPLADRFDLDDHTLEARQALGLPPQAPVLALLPGSRASELAYLATTFIRVAAMCQQAIPGLQCCVPLIDEPSRRAFVAYWQAEAPQVSLHCSIGNAHQVIQAADTVLVASGTATLEVMLCQKPMVVAYKMHMMNYWLAKRLIKTPYIALPNILAQQVLVPERIQAVATAAQLSQDVLAWFHDVERRRDTLQHFRNIHLSLRHNAAHQAAQAILQMVEFSS